MIVLAQSLPPGFVQGDVVSYSYVPNKTWTMQEGIGILPYLCEYALMEWSDSSPLTNYHAENIRRIDMASQWSTAIMLYARKNTWRDEMINLMIRIYSKRQLIILRDYWEPGEANPFQNTLDILNTLWTNRDTVLTNPEGDQATGRQIINNILMVKAGDEGFCGLRTSGLYTIYETFENTIQNRVMDSEQPFRHIRCWYNLIMYPVGCHAASAYDVTNYGRSYLPTNTKNIGPDVYHFWKGSDPLSMSTETRRAIADSWQNVITRYYPAGLSVSPCGSWAPSCRDETHVMLNGLSAARANDAMLMFIGNSCTPESYHTTPIETMDAFYDSLKAGPWVSLVWWVFDDFDIFEGTIRYVDKTLQHFTGAPYTQQQLDDFHDRFVASRMRMFNDVVYNQFGHLNPLAPVIAEVTPDPHSTIEGGEYTRQLSLLKGSLPVSWSVLAGSPGVSVNGSGYVSGWIPGAAQAGQTFTITVRATNAAGSDDETWQVLVDPLPVGTLALFPFNANAQSWTLATWKAGPYALGTMAWDSASGNSGGNLKSTGSGSTNGTDSCTREGGSATRVISTAQYTNIQIEYDVIAVLNTPPGAGCTTACQSTILEGSCEDKLVVYYSTNGTGGTWTKIQELNEGDDLPTSWTHKVISLAGVTAAENNANFGVRFKWQFNTAADTGRIDNVLIKGTSLSGNTAPQVDAGPNQAITLPNSANLDGTVSDDGLPNPPATVTVTWSKQSGPGTVTFGNANAVDTTATFSTSGTYVLRLTASDSLLSNYDEVTITVNPALPGKATNPNPANSATAVSTAMDLSWTADSGATSHKVYFGTSSPPPYKTTQTVTTYDPGTMSRLTVYYWRIDEENAGGTTTGDLWRFTTRSAPGDFDGDSDVDLTDFGHLQACFSGDQVPPATGCTDADLDGDNDVDQADFTVFKNCLGGANRPPGC